VQQGVADVEEESGRDVGVMRRLHDHAFLTGAGTNGDKRRVVPAVDG